MDGLSKETTKKGRLQRACLDLLAEHEDDGAIPTSIRFLFYELLGRGVIPKVYRHPDGTEKKRTPGQDISDAVGVLREAGRIPWTYIVDETRTLDSWRYASSVYQYVEDTLPLARINLWDGEPPLILCESRSLAGVLRDIAGRYLCPIAATNGQAGGFLRTEVAPLVEDHGEDAPRRVLYLGDLDLSGGHIEENTRRVLSEYGALEWERLAITRTQVEERELLPVRKVDKRFSPHVRLRRSKPRPWDRRRSWAYSRQGWTRSLPNRSRRSWCAKRSSVYRYASGLLVASSGPNDHATSEGAARGPQPKHQDCTQVQP
jgi:hypothetical protein